jgi:hypothetical protein
MWLQPPPSGGGFRWIATALLQRRPRARFCCELRRTSRRVCAAKSAPQRVPTDTNAAFLFSARREAVCASNDGRFRVLAIGQPVSAVSAQAMIPGRYVIDGSCPQIAKGFNGDRARREPFARVRVRAAREMCHGCFRAGMKVKLCGWRFAPTPLNTSSCFSQPNGNRSEIKCLKADAGAAQSVADKRLTFIIFATDRGLSRGSTPTEIWRRFVACVT